FVIANQKKGDQSEAFYKAVDYAKKNGLNDAGPGGTFCENITYKGEPGTLEVSFPEAYEVKVDISINSDLYFARILGFNQTPVNVSATAGLVVAEEHQGGFAPLCFFWNEDPIPDGIYKLNLQSTDGGGVKGNYGYLAYQSDDHKDGFLDYIETGYPGTLGIYKGEEIYFTDLNTAYNTLYTYTGGSIGEVDNIQHRIDYCNQYHGGACTPDNYKENCLRILLLPIVEQFWDAHGKSIVHITGFTRFFLIGYNKDTKTLTGQFIETVDETTANGGIPNDEYLVQSVKLVD
ncbi:MAG TPA: hypothetical protein VHQ70_07270, partial [Syntrophomonadaceae bacterium]|nr:hypothetical protein [Syntrophomonadaceae bacterium]